jgi:hypothetical protein
MAYMTCIKGNEQRDKGIGRKGRNVDEIEALVIALNICLLDIYIPIPYHFLPCSRWKLRIIYC